MELRDAVKSFAAMMEQVLRDNDHKGGWQHLTLRQLYNRATDEMDELVHSVFWDQAEPEKIIREAVDVANYMMMIAETAVRLKPEKVQTR